jgi:Fanconi-associated nuclease 1
VRLSVNVEHLGRPSEALELAEAGLADERVAGGDRLALQRRVLRLGTPRLLRGN